MPKFTISAIPNDDAKRLVGLLQDRLTATLDLQLTLKHVHWNVVGPSFIGVHEMIDPQVDAVRAMSDDIAERIATLGDSPSGTPGAILEHRTWDDYAIQRDTVLAHLGALDLVYDGVIGDHRSAIAATDDLDLVTQDMLIEQAEQLELFQWFIRAHLESSGGTLSNQDATTEEEAADASR